MTTKIKVSIVLSIVLVAGVLWLYTDTQRIEGETEAKLQRVEDEKVIEVDRILRSRFSQGNIAEGLRLLSLADSNRQNYQVRISLKYVPETIQEVAIVTLSICRLVNIELAERDVERHVTVWAQRPIGDGLVEVYGSTFYNFHTGEFKFHEAK